MASLDDTAARAALREHWDLADAVVEPHHGGMNSATRFVARGRPATPNGISPDQGGSAR